MLRHGLSQGSIPQRSLLVIHLIVGVGIASTIRNAAHEST